MAEKKTIEREYVIPLRRHWLNVQKYERTGKAIKAIKKFVAKHMKLPERDTDKVKLDVYLNNDLWFRGRAYPPAKVKVRVHKEGDNVLVTFVELPAHIKFLKAKHERIHKKVKAEQKQEVEKKEETKTEEQKKDEAEKGKAVEEQNLKQAEQQAKAEKHVTKVEKAAHPKRMALKK